MSVKRAMEESYGERKEGVPCSGKARTWLGHRHSRQREK